MATLCLISVLFHQLCLDQERRLFLSVWDVLGLASAIKLEKLMKVSIICAVKSYTEQLAEHSDLVAELMAEFKGKQRGISRTWKEVPAKSSFVSIMVCSQFITCKLSL
jgi:hypothetical protein